MSKRQSTAVIGLLAALVLAVAYSVIFQTPIPVQLDFPNKDTVVVNPVWPTPVPVPVGPLSPESMYDTTNLDSLTLTGNLSAADVAASDSVDGRGGEALALGTSVSAAPISGACAALGAAGVSLSSSARTDWAWDPSGCAVRNARHPSTDLVRSAIR